MQAKEIMTEQPACCTPMDGITTVAQRMLEAGCGLVPVVDSMQSMRLVGVITDRDIVCRVVAPGKDCASSTAADAMTTGKLWTVRPTSPIDEVIEKMEEGQVRRIPVVDETNTVVGIIATADIALELDDTDEISEVFEEISEPTHIPHA
jgi:CBS domain-containing protein